MKPTELTKRHVISTYVEPARQRGDKTILVKVGGVQKELGWTNRTPSVFSTLSSRSFQREAGVELVEKTGGPASGGPSTTVQFVFKVLERGAAKHAAQDTGSRIPNGAGLEKLYGIFKDEYARLGGGEEYLKAERNWGPDAWERYDREERGRKENRK